MANATKKSTPAAEPAKDKLSAAKEKYKVSATDAQILELAQLIKEQKQADEFAEYKKSLQALRPKKAKK